MSLLLTALKRAADAKRQHEAAHAGRRGEQGSATSEAWLAERDPRSVFIGRQLVAGESAQRVLVVVGALVAVTGMLALSGYVYHAQRDEQLRTELDELRNAHRQAAAPRSPIAMPLPAASPSSLFEAIPEAHPQAHSAEVAPVVGSATQTTAPALTAAARASVEMHGAPSVAGTQRTAPRRIVNIVRNDARKKIAAAVAAGYEAFHDDNPSDAQRHYARALALDARNRDAVLGLAAIAVKRGDTERAARIYRAWLRSDPGDSVAAAALSGLPGSGSTRARESELKALLRTNPRAAELHFALGTLYSSQQRWSEARAAFLQAHTRDGDNPDFVFNLAISLDHLGEAAAAEQYYVMALRASNQRAAGFDPRAARERLQRLREARSGES